MRHYPPLGGLQILLTGIGLPDTGLVQSLRLMCLGKPRQRGLKQAGVGEWEWPGNLDTVFQTLACASSLERRLRSCCLLDPGDAWGGGSSGDPWERAFRSSLR